MRGLLNILPLAAVLLFLLVGCDNDRVTVPIPPVPDLPSISIANIEIFEGDDDHVIGVTVNLSSASQETVSVQFATGYMTAVAGTDYSAATGSLYFSAGLTSGKISITIKGDEIVETDKTFKIKLSDPVNAVLGSAGATVTIINDDQEAPINFSGKILFGFGDFATAVTSTWLVTNQNEVAMPNLDYGSTAVWSPNGQMIYVFKDGKPTFLSESGATIATCNSDLDFSGCAWTSDSRQIIAGVYFDGLYSIKTDGTAQKLKPSASRTFDHCPAISKDGQWVYYIHHEYGDEATLFRIATAKLLAGDWIGNFENLAEFITTGHDETAYLGFANNNKILVAFGSEINLVDPETKAVSPIYSDDMYMVKISPDGTKIAVAQYLGNQTVRIFDLNGNLTSTWSYDDFYVSKIDWSPDSTQIAIAGQEVDQDTDKYFRSLRVWPINGSASRLVARRDLDKNKSGAMGAYSYICSWSP